MVTAGTYLKRHLMDTNGKLGYVHDTLLELAQEHGWSLQAWAVLSNHYHFVAVKDEHSGELSSLARHLHSITARELNALDGKEGRKVWYEYWDSRITYQSSYLARLKYVHHNPVKHGVAREAKNYPWCSAAWFELNAPRSFANIVQNLKTDRVKVPDDF